METVAYADFARLKCGGRKDCGSENAMKNAGQAVHRVGG